MFSANRRTLLRVTGLVAVATALGTFASTADAQEKIRIGYAISKTICGCQGCPATTFVSDTSGPDKVTAQWKALGCSCPKVLCVLCRDEPSSAICTSALTTAAAPVGGGGIIVLPRTCQDQSGTVVAQ